jgi:tripartite ATP-independent transporter DctP family solute receptor
MKTLFNTSVTATWIAAISLLSAGAQAQVSSHNIKFGYSVSETHPIGKGVSKFAELVSEKSGGKIKVKAYPAAQLGSESQMISATQGGVQEMIGMSSAPLVGIVKDFALFDLPFIFSSEKEADAVVDGPVGTKLFEKLNKKGVVGLCYWENGFRHVTNSKRPIVRLEDFKGLKIRTMQNPVFVDMFNTLGANSVPMAWPEVYSALETKAIDAQENPALIVSTFKINEVQKYLSITKHAYSPYALMVSAKFWEKLNPVERGILKDSCVEARDYQRKLSREEDKKTLVELKSHGMLINELSPDAVAQIKQQLQPVTEKYAKEIDADLMREVRSEIEKVRSASK